MYKFKLKSKIAEILNNQFTQYFVSFFITISILAVIASSFEEMKPYQIYLFGITYISSFVFLIEFVARIFSAPISYPKMNAFRARLKYTFSFYGFVDFIAILPCILSYFFWDTPAVHIIILPYIFIIFKLIRHLKAFHMIGLALKAVKDELITAYTACLIVVSFSAILMYYTERNAQPDVFRNIGDGIWWAIVTFTTTGYGDIYPITFIGKLLGIFISMIGIAMIAIPSGIIGSSFINIIQKREAEKLNEKNKDKKK